MWTVLSSHTDDLWICSPPGREKRKWVRVKHLTLSAPLWSPSNIISSSGGSTTSSNGPASRREPLAGSPPAPSHIWLSGNSAARRSVRYRGMLIEEEEEDFYLSKRGAKCLRCENSQRGWANPGRPRKSDRACRRLWGPPWTLWWAELFKGWLWTGHFSHQG